MASLGALPGGIFYSDAAGASADGAIMVGASSSSFGGQAFRWTQADLAASRITNGTSVTVTQHVSGNMQFFRLAK